MNDSLRRALPSLRAVRAIVLLGSAIGIAAVFGLVMAYKFIADERARELWSWQTRLGVAVDGRVAAVEGWIDDQRGLIRGLAENSTVRLYLTELATAAGDPTRISGETAQAVYVENLLAATAERSAFGPPAPRSNVPANVDRPRAAGLALLDAKGRVVVATHEMPTLAGRLLDLVKRAERAEGAIEDMFLGPSGRPSMAFAAPVPALAGEGATSFVGHVVGIKEVGEELNDRLTRPPTPERSDETLLLRQRDGSVEYLVPLADGTTAMRKRLPVATPHLAEVAALTAPGDLLIGRDYRNVEVLAVSRPITGVSWTLMHKIDRLEAMQAAETRLNRLFGIFVLAIVLLVVAMVAIWRHGSSQRAYETSRRFEALARRFEHQGQLLRIVTDSQPASILITDLEGRLRFVNKKLANRLGTSADDLLGKSLASVFGPAEARRYEQQVQTALETRTIQPEVLRSEGDGEPRILHTEYVPLPPTGEHPPGVLVIEEDITAPIVERERRERTLRQLVRTLVAIVDRRDPFAAHHSQRVAGVARRIAEEMRLDPVLVETAEIAGSLMNLGKILVPEELLTRGGNLSQAERDQIRDSLKLGADLLESVEFDGPVVATLRSAQERWDGSGPRGLKGVEILVTARIVAVANAFVGMASARAHRPGLDLDQAIGALMQQAGTIFDRRVVAALLHDLENRGGRARWADFGVPPADVPKPAPPRQAPPPPRIVPRAGRR
ncbi:MAG TPA: HD domain-containing phosphohydrolase [Alphaproteobacteria bacterium]|nr:HD domain-containing phosphohydrolase [Alphaproteobacteria bacterium]